MEVIIFQSRSKICVPLAIKGFDYTEKTVSLICGQRKRFFELKKVLLIQKNLLWSKEIDLFTLKNIFLNQQNFFQFKEMFSLTLYQRNVSLIQRNYFLGVIVIQIRQFCNFCPF